MEVFVVDYFALMSSRSPEMLAAPLKKSEITPWGV